MYSRSGETTGYGTLEGLCGVNCRHNFYPFFEGISKRSYTNKQLEDIKNHTVEYIGKQLTDYDAKQLQRRFERNIRTTKQELVMYDEAKKNVTTDEEKALWQQEFNNSAVKLKGQEAKLRDFCKQTGFSVDNNRTQVFAVATENGIKSFGKSVSRKAVSSAKQRYKEFIAVVGANNAPETLEKYYEMKYNNPEFFRYLQLDYKRRERLIKDNSLKLPNSEKVVVKDEKFTGYLFNPANPRGYEKGKNITGRLGYDISNYGELKDLIKNSASKYPTRYILSDQYGDKYEQKIVLYGKKGKPANVIVGWKVKGQETWMSSVYIKEVKHDS